MNLLQAIQFLKVTIEQNVLAAVKVLKANVFTVELKSDKVTVKNPLKLPSTFKVKEISPINNKKDIEQQTKQLSDTLNRKFTELNNLVKTLSPKSKISIDNLDEMPKPIAEVTIKNPVKTISINNFYEIQKEIGKLQKVMQSLKLNPQINVPEIKLPDIKIPKSKAEVILDRRETLLSDDAKKYVPVRLSDGKKFYRALEDFTIKAATTTSFSDSSGLKQKALVDADRHLQVDIITMPESGSTIDISTLATKDNQTNGLQQAKIKEVSPVDTTKTNASYVLSYNSSDELVRIDKIISGTTYRKSIIPISGDTAITQVKSFAAWITV